MTEIYIFLGIVGVAILISIPFIVIKIWFTNKAEGIKAGTSYKEVIELLGEPDTETASDEITTCMWKRRALIGAKFSSNATSYVITFKDDKVLSVTIL